MSIRTMLAMGAATILFGCSNTTNSDPDGAPIFVDAEAVPEIDAMIAAPDAEPEVVALRINELMKNPPGSGDTHEFFEVYGPADTNLSNFTLVVLESDRSADEGLGEIDMLIALGTTGPGGFYVSEFFGDEFANGSSSVLLVENLEAAVAVGDDLDTNDDGQLDAEPWDTVIDSVALIDDPEDLSFAEVSLTNDLGGEDEEFVGASRFPDGAYSGQASDWVRANGEGVGLEGVPGAGGAPCDGCGEAPARPGRALITPGAANAIVE